MSKNIEAEPTVTDNSVGGARGKGVWQLGGRTRGAGWGGDGDLCKSVNNENN